MIDAEIYAKPWGFPLEEVQCAGSALARKKGSHLSFRSRSKSRSVSRIANFIWSKARVTIRCRFATCTKFWPILKAA